MFFYSLFWVFGWLILALAIGLPVLLIVGWCCGVSVDSLLTWGEESTTLTCFHCGQLTQANRKTCEHCGGELQ